MSISAKGDGTDYFELVDSLSATPIRLDEQGEADASAGRYLALRHDVDHDLEHALRFARQEARQGLSATYFLLHTAAYFEDVTGLQEGCRELAALGHEVGLHNNAITVWLTTGQEVATTVARSLDLLRGAGVEVRGTASHGDRLCHERRYVNYEVWAECPAAQRRNGVPDVPRLPLADFGLDYEAYFLPRDEYLSDSGGRWSEPPAGLAERFRSRDCGVVQLLAHPVWWRVR